MSRQPVSSQPTHATAALEPPRHLNRDDLRALGRARREAVPRGRLAEWSPDGRQDPVKTLKASNRSRLPGIVPIRIGRMSGDPFAFLRGSAGVMANDSVRRIPVEASTSSSRQIVPFSV